MSTKPKTKPDVPGLTDNKAYCDGLALTKEDGHEASDSIKHWREARRCIEAARRLGADYPQAKKRVDGLVSQRARVIGQLEQTEARMKPLKASITALDLNIEAGQQIIDALPEAARRDFNAELAEIDKRQRDAAQEADQCRTEGREIPAALVSRSLALEKERAALQNTKDEHEARIREQQEAGQDQTVKSSSSLVTSLRSYNERQRSSIRKVMASRGTLHKLFPECLASDAWPFWDRARQAAQIIVRLGGAGSVSVEMEKTFWPGFSEEQRDRLESAVRLGRQPVALPRRPEPNVTAGATAGT